MRLAHSGMDLVLLVRSAPDDPRMAKAATLLSDAKISRFLSCSVICELLVMSRDLQIARIVLRQDDEASALLSDGHPIAERGASR